MLLIANEKNIHNKNEDFQDMRCEVPRVNANLTPVLNMDFKLLCVLKSVNIYLFNWTIEGSIEICRTHVMLECELSTTVFS